MGRRKTTATFAGEARDHLARADAHLAFGAAGSRDELEHALVELEKARRATRRAIRTLTPEGPQPERHASLCPAQGFHGPCICGVAP